LWSTIFAVLASRLGGAERDKPAEIAGPGAVRFAAKLVGEADATGRIAAAFDPASRVLSWSVEYAEFEGAPIRAYFSVAEKEWDGEPDPDRLLLSGALASPIAGRATLTERQSENLTGGKWTFTLESADDRIYQALQPAR
jgi:hypothetical protein